MATRQWRYYKEPGLDGIKLGKFASSTYSSKLARSCTANYAQTRRNVLAITTNVDNTLIVPPPIAAGYWLRWLHIPIAGRIIAPGTLKVWILATTPASELAANNIHCQVKVGQYYTQGTLTLDTTDPTWSSFTVTLDGIVRGGALEISFRTVGTNTLTIYGVSAYQPGDTNAPVLVDVSDSWLGTADYPDDVFAMELLRDNVVAVRGWKTVRANVFNHWYHKANKIGAAYSVAAGIVNGELGKYKFVKRRGISEVKLHFLATAEVGVEAHKIRAELTGLDNPPAAQETAIADGVNLVWYTNTFTINAADVDAEFECELLLDGKSDDAPFAEMVYLVGFSLIETDPDTPRAHTVPDVTNFDVNDPIEADHHENIWDTCHDLWFNGGRQIICSDWRHCGVGETESRCLCLDNAFDNQDWIPGLSVICRALLFSSTSSQRLRIRMGYHTDINGGTPGTRAKGIHMCITETIDGAHCSHIDGNPMYDGDDDNDHYFSDAIDGADGRPVRVIDACMVEIDSADWENQLVAPEPPQVLIEAITDNADEYIVPDWITVEEVNLGETEFP